MARGLLPRRAWLIPVLTPITVFLLCNIHTHTHPHVVHTIHVQAHIGTQTCGEEKVRGEKKKSRFSSKDKQRANFSY